MARRRTQTTEADIVQNVLNTLWELFTLPFKSRGSRSVDQETTKLIVRHWEGVLAHLAVPTTEALAVSEADKLLDAALQNLGLPGPRMADRLKAVEGRLGQSLAQEVWWAHKLRNRLAHEVGTKLAPGQALTAVRAFEKALHQLGVRV